jgi:heme oxygenase (biliverdin-IX-beta and delta-forming)
MPEANVSGYANAVTQGPRRGLLWTQLRESTPYAHAQAEASLAPLAQPDSLVRYLALLCVLWGFQAPVERLLGHQRLPSAVDWPARQRLGALAADLADLGVTGTSLPEAAGLPALAGPGAVWGTLYVTEGSTLGGRVLRRHIEARLGPVPARFLDGRGDRTQPMWRDLGRLADRYVDSKQDSQLAHQTAIQAFAAFGTWAADNGKTQLNIRSG